MTEHHAVLITSAGSSSRMGIGEKKEYLLLEGVPVLQKSLEAFFSTGLFHWYVITVPPGGEVKAKEVLSVWLQAPKQRESTLIVSGGATRQESVRLGLLALQSHNPSTVLIHDGARPWIHPNTIQAVWEAVQKEGACAPVIPLVDSLKRLSPEGTIAEHVDRSAFVGIQTPQGFRYEQILKAHLLAASDGKEYLDDTEIYHRYMGPVHTVPGDRRNRKITFAEDLQMETTLPQVRIGFGYDLHRLVENRTLWIGGVAIPFSKGEEGHSDGDVLIHALIDALLGATCLGDIGTHFPPTDPQYKNISSRLLLKETRSLIGKSGWRVINLDCTVVLEEPKLRPHREQICRTLSQDLGIDPEVISIKGKTKEKVDAVGQGQAVEAYVVALLEKLTR